MSIGYVIGTTAASDSTANRRLCTTYQKLRTMVAEGAPTFSQTCPVNTLKFVTEKIIELCEKPFFCAQIMKVWSNVKQTISLRIFKLEKKFIVFQCLYILRLTDTIAVKTPTRNPAKTSVAWCLWSLMREYPTYKATITCSTCSAGSSNTPYILLGKRECK